MKFNKKKKKNLKRIKTIKRKISGCQDLFAIGSFEDLVCKQKDASTLEAL